MSLDRAWLVIPLLACSFGICLSAQTTEGEAQAERQTLLTLENEQIPYALRATMFLKSLAEKQEMPLEGGGNKAVRRLVTLGLESDSPAAVGLIEAAVAFKAAIPVIDTRAILKLEKDASLAAQRAHQVEIHRLAGEAMGTWLRTLAVQEAEIESMFTKLLDNPYTVMAIGTTDPELNMALITAKKQAFEQGIMNTLGYVPSLMMTSGPAVTQ